MTDPSKPYLLKTGGRRFRAHELLGKDEIESRIWPEDMTESEFRFVELEENLQRKD